MFIDLAEKRIAAMVLGALTIAVQASLTSIDTP